MWIFGVLNSCLKVNVLYYVFTSTAQCDESAEPVFNEDGEVEQGRGIGVQDCVRVTQQVGAMLDVHDPISGEYALEVSSPGWDRPFFQLEQMSGVYRSTSGAYV